MSDEIDAARLAAFADLQLITVPELAHLAQTGEDWIRKGCQAALLPYTRVGGTYRFTRDQVAAIWQLNNRTATSVPTADEVRRKRVQFSQRKAA